MTLNAIAEKFAISRPAVSQHIKHLTECGVVEIEQKGRERFCKINPKSLIPAFMWLEQYQQPVSYTHLDVYKRQIILFAHISMDRIFGYGLKFNDSFFNTHLGKIGKNK